MATWNVQNISISIDELKAKAAEFNAQGYRLVQLCCVKEPAGDVPAETLELIYTFDKSYEAVNLRLVNVPGTVVPSISDSFGCAFLYENEIHDLYGIEVTGINIDFKGNLYKVSKPHAFNPDMEATDSKGSES